MSPSLSPPLVVLIEQRGLGLGILLARTRTREDNVDPGEMKEQKADQRREAEDDEVTINFFSMKLKERVTICRPEPEGETVGKD